MDALCFGLFAFGLVLFFVSVIGHGLWLLFAAIFRGSVEANQQHRWPPEAPSRLPRPTFRCASCGEVISHEWFCPSCGLESQGPIARELRELDVALQSL